MAKGFASTTDMAEKKITFSEIGTDLYAFTAEGDPNSAIIVGDDGCLVFDAQSTPAMATKVIERVRTVTDNDRGVRIALGGEGVEIGADFGEGDLLLRKICGGRETFGHQFDS